jgi:hypothetical protein
VLPEIACRTDWLLIDPRLPFFHPRLHLKELSIACWTSLVQVTQALLPIKWWAVRRLVMALVVAAPVVLVVELVLVLVTVAVAVAVVDLQ